MDGRILWSLFFYVYTVHMHLCLCLSLAPCICAMLCKQILLVVTYYSVDDPVGFWCSLIFWRFVYASSSSFTMCTSIHMMMSCTRKSANEKQTVLFLFFFHLFTFLLLFLLNFCFNCIIFTSFGIFCIWYSLLWLLLFCLDNWRNEGIEKKLWHIDDKKKLTSSLNTGYVVGFGIAILRKLSFFNLHMISTRRIGVFAWYYVFEML